jgi:Amt family ammonium transporter
MNRIWGTLAIGLFATENGVTGLAARNTSQIVAQLIGVAAVGLWCLATGAILFNAIKFATDLRVSREEEIKGLDIEEHGTEAYPRDVVGVPGIADKIFVGGEVVSSSKR